MLSRHAACACASARQKSVGGLDILLWPLGGPLWLPPTPTEKDSKNSAALRAKKNLRAKNAHSCATIYVATFF